MNEIKALEIKIRDKYFEINTLEDKL